MKLRNVFADASFNRKLLRLTLPLAFQSLMLALVAAADSFMLGHVHQDSMAAVSLASQIQFVQNMVVSTVASAGAILGAQYWGKGEKTVIDRLFLIMLRFSGLASLAFGGACLIIPEPLMHLFASEADLIRIGAEYLRIAGWSYILVGVSQCYLTIMKVTGHERMSAGISSGSVVLNIILNAVFIFGIGVKPMLARGATLATLIARAAELACAVVVSAQPGYRSPRWRSLFAPFGELTRDFVRISLPLLGAALLWGVGFTAYTAILGHIGGDAAADNSICAVVRDLFCCLCNGISAAAGIMVGNELGAGRLEQGKLYGRRLTVVSYIIGFLCTALVLAVMPLVERFMVLTDEAASLMHGMMIVMAFYMIGRCVNTVVINGVFAAGGDTLFDMYSLVACMWCLALPLAALGAFVFNWPVVAVYACTCLDEVGKIPWVMAHYRKYKWVKDLTNDAAAV